MTSSEFTLADLRRILLAGAGAEEGVDLRGDILDATFDELGYESLALLETGGRIEREFGISLADSVLAEATTPRALIDAVNEHIAVTSGTAV